MTHARAVVLTVSDRSSRGEREDLTGPCLVTRLTELGFAAARMGPVPDERAEISMRLRQLSEDHDLILTTGGTGLAPRDVTPEATRDVIDREAPGLAEEMRRRSAEGFPRGILSRGVCGTRDRCLIVNLPGSPKGAIECLDFIAPVLAHAMQLLGGAVVDCGKPGGAR